MLNTDMVPEELCRVFDSSPLPSAVMDKSGIIYANKAFEFFAAEISTDIITGCKAAAEKYVCCGGKLFKAYISTFANNAFLINITPAASFSDDCFEVLSAAVRHAVSKVAAASDDLFELYNTESAAKLLNIINSSMLTLMSEFLIPEEIMQLKNTPTGGYAPTSVSKALTQFSERLSEIFSRHNVQINANISAGMFAKADMRAVTLFLTDFAVKAMNGERHIEAIGIRLFRNGADRMKIVLTCGHILGIPSELSDESVLKPENYSPESELETLLAGCFDCRISRTDNADLSSVTIDMPMSETPMSDGLHSPMKIYGRDRFSDESVYLSRFGIDPPYKI